MAVPLNEEMRSLLETLAGGFVQDDACMCCGARLTTVTQEVMTNIHVATCPVLRARKQLALQGTPVKMFSIIYETRRLDRDKVETMDQHVIRPLLSEEDALDLVMDYLARKQGKRQLVEGSIRIREIGVVPIEEIAFITMNSPSLTTHTNTEV